MCPITRLRAEGVDWVIARLRKQETAGVVRFNDTRDVLVCRLIWNSRCDSSTNRLSNCLTCFLFR
ncbi:hypothetical protein HanIR_Chr12g0562671 [Helianthus annuus]|nr:hypothetical protein HanIR_Chr12g0562671 [Helianthus annuus]